MSTNINLTTDVIQHIDDACEEEYIESFAPKAQEEVLSESQENNLMGDNEEVVVQQEVINNENDSSNLVDCEKSEENSESLDLSNEEDINVASNQLIKEVISDVESNINIEVKQDEEESFDKPNVDDESIDTDVVMEEKMVTSSNEEIVNEECYENLEIEEAPEVINSNQEDVEIVAESNDSTEDHVTDEAPNVEESSILDTTSIEILKVEEKKEETIVELPTKIETKEQIKTVSSPTKGKDVKSLSSSYGHEENLTNGSCCICNKIVYPMEKLSTNDRLFHKTCFRCTKCKNALSPGNFTFNQGKPYCTPHYVELFKKRGRYDEIDDSIPNENPITTDINDVLTDELPAPDTTKNILAKFRDLETTGGNNANQTTSSDLSDELPAPNTTKNLMERFSALGQEKAESKCKPKIDIPRHTNGHSNGTSENEPIILSKDVVRANDPSQDDRPEQGITKNLVNRFREMESSSNN